MYWFGQSREKRSFELTGSHRFHSAGARRSRCVPLGARSNCTMDQRPFETEEREPCIRWELVQKVRREIAAGIYETPEKLEVALERLLDCLDHDR